MSITGSSQVSDMTRSGQNLEKRRGMVFCQRQAIHVFSDMSESPGAWMGSFNAGTKETDYHPFLTLESLINDKKTSRGKWVEIHYYNISPAERDQGIYGCMIKG